MPSRRSVVSRAGFVRSGHIEREKCARTAAPPPLPRLLPLSSASSSSASTTSCPPPLLKHARGSSYDVIRQRPVEVMRAIFEAMGLDPSRVTPDMISKTMQQDSQANSSLSRKALDQRDQMGLEQGCGSEAGLCTQEQVAAQGAGGRHRYDECMWAVKEDIDHVVRAFVSSDVTAERSDQRVQGVARGVSLSAPLLADSSSSKI